MDNFIIRWMFSNSNIEVQICLLAHLNSFLPLCSRSDIHISLIINNKFQSTEKLTVSYVKCSQVISVPVSLYSLIIWFFSVILHMELVLYFIASVSCWKAYQSVQLLSRVQLFVTPWTVARQVSLSIANSRSLLKLMSLEFVIPSSHLILFLLFVVFAVHQNKSYCNEIILEQLWVLFLLDN